MFSAFSALDLHTPPERRTLRSQINNTVAAQQRLGPGLTASCGVSKVQPSPGQSTSCGPGGGPRAPGSDDDHEEGSTTGWWALRRLNEASPIGIFKHLDPDN